jgi:DNA-binding XRE family transcriptional regulator
MPNKPMQSIDFRTVELDGSRYVILRESVFQAICRKAGIRLSPLAADEPPPSAFEVDQPSLAERLAQRRQAVGLSQAELARRAKVRPETLNRIERGRVTPDFATIRKLVVAIGAFEQQRAASSISTICQKEPENVDRKQPAT